MLKMFWNKENVDIWNYQVIEMIVKNGEGERIIIQSYWAFMRASFVVKIK